MKGEGSTSSIQGIQNSAAIAIAALSLSALLLVFVPAAHADTQCDQATTTATGGYFTAYQSDEYSDGLLTQRFKNDPTYPYTRTTRLRWNFFDDACAPIPFYTAGPYVDFTLPQGVTDWSIRFTTPSHFEVWDDDHHVIVASSTDPFFLSYPSYASISFVGTVEPTYMTGTYFSARTNKIVESGAAPLMTGTLPTPDGCPTFFASNLFDSSYEHAEYVDGLLRVHVRFGSPAYSGQWVRTKTLSVPSSCNRDSQIYPTPWHGVSLPVHMKYFSFRMTSPTHWILWDDETDTKITCAPFGSDGWSDGCEGDLDPSVPYISFYMDIGSGSVATLITTPFPPVEQAPQSCTPGQDPDCNSNVLFLPGIEASRLFATSTDFLGLEHENQLWEPNRNADVDKLALSSSTGESLNPTIYTNDVIDETIFPVVGSNIYKSFLDDMNELVAQETIRSFKALPYDWRMDVRDVVRNPIKTKSDHYSMVDEVEKAAHDSRTGKVTIIAHSNGGLVAKALLDELEIRGEADLVDKVIFVATPQLGTPQGVVSMLHGDEFGPFGFIKKEHTREVAENMKSGYALLPSLDYFSTLGFGADPIIEFSTTTPLTLAYREAYGNSISTYPVLRRFMLAEGDGRNEPAASDVSTPNKLKEHFMLNAEDWHSTHGSLWTPPAGVQTINVVGWGIPTLRGIRYGEEDGMIDPQPLGLNDIKMIEGDGTVVYPSADAVSGTTYWVNIKEYNDATIFNREHKNILEIDPLRILLANIITNTNTALPPFITYNKPTAGVVEQLNIGVHSPVALHLYDAAGRHTGPIPNPDPNSDFDIYEEQIPNSYYWRIGEGQYAGADTTSSTIVLKGTDTGTFDIDIHHIIGAMASTTVFSDIPVTASTTATIEGVGDDTALSLAVDINGDGTVDATIAPGEGITAQELVSLLRGIADSLDLPAKQDKKLDKKIVKLQKVLDKEYKNEQKEKRKFSNVINTIISRITKWEQKGILTNEEAASLIAILEQIKASKNISQ